MAYSTKSLPQSTRQHLFDLVTNPVYRQNADSASYDYVPQGDGKMAAPKGRDERVRKYGYNANLAAGTASRGNGPDPGRYRLVAFAAKVAGGAEGRRDERTTWWVAEHAPGNTYRYHKINIPACGACGGTADKICGACGGSGRMRETATVFAGPCQACNRSGFSACTDCAPPVVVDGRTISRNFQHWS